jgi:hypothetical protein
MERSLVIVTVDDRPRQMVFKTGRAYDVMDVMWSERLGRGWSRKNGHFGKLGDAMAALRWGEGVKHWCVTEAFMVRGKPTTREDMSWVGRACEEEESPGCWCDLCRDYQPLGLACDHVFWCDDCRTHAGSGVLTDCYHPSPVTGQAREAVAAVAKRRHSTECRGWFDADLVDLHPFHMANQVWATREGRVLAEFADDQKPMYYVVYNPHGQIVWEAESSTVPFKEAADAPL